MRKLVGLRIIHSTEVGVQGVVNDESARGRLFVFMALENGYLWLAWECIPLTKVEWSCAMWRMWRMGLDFLR